MMFDVRCLSCKQSIAKGVRFNAHKKCGKEYSQANAIITYSWVVFVN